MKKIKKQFRIFLLFWVILLPLVTINLNDQLYSKEKSSENLQENIRLFADTLMLIRENYVDEVSFKDLIYGALKGMVSTLDAYSQFMEPDQAELLKSDTEGEFGGLGIRITTQDDYITIITPLPETPAYRVGVMPGDKIVKIDGESAKGISLREAVKKLRGPKGSKVKLSIARNGEAELLEIEIIRDIIVPKKVYKKVLKGNIGYVRLVEFTEDAPDKFKKALKNLLDQKVKGVIFDLRNNPGGLLSAAVEISGFFVEKGELIVYTKGRRPEQNRKFYAKSAPVTADMPLVVLINKGSASGSEIVAGCIKDLGRGVVVGEQSFGKASVQSIIDLEDESSLRLTTAKYYTPSGISIHGKGIEPHISVSLTREQRIKIIEQQEEIINLSEKEKKVKEAEKSVDPQLERAMDVLTVRSIFIKDDSKEKQEKEEKPETK
jgi:carboxyl-terminal processing protease